MNMTLLNETEQFDSEFFEQIRYDTAGRLRNRLFIPCTDANWARLNKYIKRASSGGDISDYWRLRTGDFSYSRRPDGVVCITGYFDATFPNDYPAVRKAVPPIQKIRRWIARRMESRGDDYSGTYEEARKTEISELFHSKYAESVLGWYPMLAPLIDVYNWVKCADLAWMLAEEVKKQEIDRPLRILEIGAGGALVSLLLRRLLPIDCFNIIDLDFVAPLGFLISSYADPDGHVALPGEEHRDDDVVRYFTPEQATLADQSVDICLNVTSFQEMNRDIVAGYFKLMERTLAPGGMFLCVNRLEKRGASEEDIMRFDDYPWPKTGFETLINEEDLVSRVSRRRFPIMRRLIRKLPS